MTILFSPSEGKQDGGEGLAINKNSFIFEKEYEKRESIIKKYNDVVKNSSLEELKKLFGVKKEELVNSYRNDLFTQPTMKAIQRYDGVAFEYLDYNSLNEKQQDYIDQHVIIFSNLFGPILANDEIPNYKIKQGEKLQELAIEKYYSEHFTNTLDEYLKDKEILDLRAGFYEKFYKLSRPYTTLKFIKDGKVVSHWAKAYRGIVLKSIAKNSIETLNEFMKMEIDNLTIKEIKKQKLKTEIIYNILK